MNVSSGRWVFRWVYGMSARERGGVRGLKGRDGVDERRGMCWEIFR